MPYALITRPFPDADVTRLQLEARGIRCAISPMLTIDFCADIAPIPRDAQAVIVTSANAVRALNHAGITVSCPMIAVGEGTAAEARKMGFGHVETASGDVDGLEGFICKHYTPTAGRLIYASGDVTSGNLAQRLTKRGYAIERRIIYRATTSTAFSAQVQDDLARGAFNMVLFFSRRTAETFVSLLNAQEREIKLANTYGFCLSTNVAEPLATLPWKKIVVAPRPDSESLLETIARFGVV